MEIIINDINGQEKELLITAPWNMIEEGYNDILKKYARLPVKGFRAGKAPAGAIESFFKNQIKNDLVAATSARLCHSALKEKNTEAGTPLEISEIDVVKGDHLKFKAAFIEMPQFELPDYNHLNIESEEKEAQLDEVSLKLLERTQITLHPVFIENELKYSDDVGETSEAEKEAAAQRVKLMLILKKIANRDNIEIDEKDVEERIKLIAAENDVTSDDLREYLVTNNGLSRLADSLLAEAVLAYIIEIN